MSELTLRPYQEEGIEQLRASYASGKRAPLYQLATGGGKTVCFGAITQLSAARGKRVLILVHRRELLKQASDKLTWAGVGHGLIAAGFEPHPERLVQVASVQTLVRREIQEVDLIITDECHHVRAKTWKTLIESQPNARLLGVTATPIRLDGKGLGAEHGGFFDDIVCGPSIRELTDSGVSKSCEVLRAGGEGAGQHARSEEAGWRLLGLRRRRSG